MASEAISSLIMFIAAMLVAATVAGVLIGAVGHLSGSVDTMGSAAQDRIDTDIEIISDPGSNAIGNHHDGIGVGSAVVATTDTLSATSAGGDEGDEVSAGQTGDVIDEYQMGGEMYWEVNWDDPDTGTGWVHDDDLARQEANVTLLIKNTGTTTLTADGSGLEVVVNGEYVASDDLNVTVLEGDAWRSGGVAEVEIDHPVAYGEEHRVLVIANGNEADIEFFVQ